MPGIHDHQESPFGEYVCFPKHPRNISRECNKLMRYPRIGGARPEAGERGLGGQEDIQQSTRRSCLHFVCVYLLGNWEVKFAFLMFFPFAFENNDAGCENSYLFSSVHSRAMESVV